MMIVEWYDQLTNDIWNIVLSNCCFPGYIQHHSSLLRDWLYYYAPAVWGALCDTALGPSVCLSVCPSPRRAVAVGTLASCSLAMCGLRTRPRTDVDPPCHSQLLIAMCWIVYSSCNDQMLLLILAPTDDLCGWAMRAVATIALSTCSHSPLRSCKLFYSVL